MSGEATIDGGLFYLYLFSGKKGMGQGKLVLIFVFSGYVLGGASGGCIDLVPKRPVFFIYEDYVSIIGYIPNIKG